MKVFRLYLDTEKEVKWLNEMSEHGWKLKSFFLGVYTFEECESGKYLYQEDTTETFFKVSDEYREFMNDAGIEIVQVWGPWVILCREKDKGEFELFTDYESRLAHQEKILKIFTAVAVLEFGCLIIELVGMFRESGVATFGTLLIGAIFFIFCKMIYITRNRINKLREDKVEL